MNFETKLYKGDDLNEYVEQVRSNYLYIPGYGIEEELNTMAKALETKDNELRDEFYGIIGYLTDSANALPIVNCLFTRTGWFSIYTNPSFRFKGYGTQLINQHRDLIKECKCWGTPHTTEGLKFFNKAMKDQYRHTNDINTESNRNQFSGIIDYCTFTDYVHQLIDTVKEPYLLDNLTNASVSAVFVECCMEINNWFKQNCNIVIDPEVSLKNKKHIAGVLSDILTTITFRKCGSLNLKQFNSYLHECINGYLDCLLYKTRIVHNGLRVGYLHK